MTRTLVIPGRRYEGFGRCIFCPTDLPSSNNLTDEHVIPYYLSGIGEQIINNATCVDCAVDTNKEIDTPSSNDDFLLPRLWLRLKRRKSKSPKAPRPAAVIRQYRSYGRLNYIHPVRIEDNPTIWAFIAFATAGRLFGEDYGDRVKAGPGYLNFGDREVTIRVESNERVHDTVEIVDDGKRRARRYVFRWKLNHLNFGRTIAKIAYCHAIASRRISIEDAADLRDAVMGRRKDLFNFVGGFADSAEEKERLPKDELHRLHFQTRGEWLTVIVHLFASFGGPAYEVVVGRSAHDKG